MRKVEEALSEALSAGRPALVGYLTAGFPDLEKSCQAARTLVENGCDIVEVGIPYSDPGMDVTNYWIGLDAIYVNEKPQ